MIQLLILFGTVVCMDMSGYKRVDSEYSYLVPMDFDFSKKDFLKDGPPAPFDKAIIYSWDEENEYYKCQSVAENGTAAYCETWSANEESSSASGLNFEKETGVCNCLENSMGPNYCTYWFCTQIEVEIASRLTSTYRDVYRTTTVNRDTEYTDCVCRYESLSGKYCQQWWCLETGKDGTTEIEEYNCDLASHKGGEFCLRWRGRISSSKEKEWSRCKCDRPLEDHCDYWTCFEKEHERSYHANFIWFMVLSCVSLVLLLGVCACTWSSEFQRCQGAVSYFFVVLLGFFVGGFCVLAGGLIGLFTGVLWTLIAVVLLNLRSKQQNNNQNNTSNKQSNKYEQYSKFNNNDQNYNQENKDNRHYGGPSDNIASGVPVGYPAPTQEVQMYSSTSGPISAPSAPTYYQTTI